MAPVLRRSAGLFWVLALAAPAVAQPPVEPSSGAPAPSSSGDDAICTDRPTKSDNACTVDKGRFQYEADVVNASFQRLDGVTTDTWIVANPTFKYGVAPDLDVEAQISPLEIVRSHGEGPAHTVAGISDLFLRAKYQFLNAGGILQAAVVPYVKVPTARPQIGNGVVEGGAVVPISYKIDDTFSVTTMPEFDAYKDSVGGGRHFNTAQLVSLSATLPHRVTVSGELWGDWEFDPTGVTRQYSADAAVAYLVSNSVQLDAGVNFGLNRSTPGVQAYVGVSQRF